MDASTAAILGLVGLLALNQLVMRVGGLRGRLELFWGLQVVNVGAGAAILWFGLPGLDGVPVFSWLLGLLFLFRAVQNNVVRAAWLRERARAEEEESARARVREALHRGEGDGP